jgi:hypothetical protein
MKNKNKNKNKKWKKFSIFYWIRFSVKMDHRKIEILLWGNITVSLYRM